jgi:hypothetical protein
LKIRGDIRGQGAPPVSTTPVVHLELRISPQIFGKKSKWPYVLKGLGKTDSGKKPEVENLVTLPLNIHTSGAVFLFLSVLADFCLATFSVD